MSEPQLTIRSAKAKALAGPDEVDGLLPRRFFATIREELAAAEGPAELDAAKASVGEALVRLETVTEDLLAKRGDPTAPLKQRKLILARFFAARLLPQTRALEAAIQAGAADIIALESEVF